MKPVVILLSVILVLLQYRLWLSHDGLPSLLHLNRTVNLQQQQNEQLAERNAVLAAEVQDLKSGLDALEERARSGLGMIKPGETFFHVIENTRSDH
jgi:cell division protein FtsB